MEEKRCCATCGLSICDMSDPEWFVCMGGIEPVKVRPENNSKCSSWISEDEYNKIYYGIDPNDEPLFDDI